MIGGPRFYERAEIKDAIAYLQVLDNPTDAVSLLRIANRPRRGIGDTTLARLVALRRRARASRSSRRSADPEEAGLGAAPCKAVTRLHERCSSRSMPRAAGARGAASSSSACSSGRGTLEALEAERTIEARGRIENLAGARRRRAASTGSRPRSRRSSASCRRSRSTPTRTTLARRGAAS